MAVKAHFKTAYGQREIVLDTKVAADLHVGYLVTLSGSGDSTSIAAATSATPSAGQYIVAQSDMTMGRRDYSKYEFEYSDVVAASTSALKKVALFRVDDPSDVIAETV
jgi:hypothetical protein